MCGCVSHVDSSRIGCVWVYFHACEDSDLFLGGPLFVGVSVSQNLSSLISSLYVSGFQVHLPASEACSLLVGLCCRIGGL